MTEQAQFIQATLSRLTQQSAPNSSRKILLPSLTLELDGWGAPSSSLEKMLKAFALVQEADSASHSYQLAYVHTKDPLGMPPSTWPFSVDDRDSFQRVYWDDQFAMTSDETVGLWNLADKHQGLHLTWLSQESRLPSWEFAAPFRHHLHWQALAQNSLLAHAASWAVGDSALLLTGPGGSGKSTTSIAAAAMGRELYAEDLTWVNLSQDTPNVVALYRTQKATYQAQERFSVIRDYVSSHPHEEHDKTLIWPNAKTPVSRPLQALYCLSGQFTPQTQIKVCSAALAFRLLAPSTLFLMRTANRLTLERLRTLVERLPCFAVSLGDDPTRVVEDLEAHFKTITGFVAQKDSIS